MAEPDNQQFGDGSDNYGQAASQMAKAAKQAGQEAAKQAAAKGVEAGANAAAATVQAGVEGGKAVAEVAAGTAAGGPWGAILSAAWALRHTLFKILICICLFLLIIIMLIVSLPTIVTNSVFGLDGTVIDMENPTSLLDSYNDLAAELAVVVDEGYDAALAKVEQIIEDGGYDYDLSMDVLVNYAHSSAGYDVSYILAAYSASLQQRNTSKADMLAKLSNVAGSMFPVTYAEKETERIVPLTYSTYKPVTLTVVTSQTQTGMINGIPQYRYTTARRTYYEPDGAETTSEPVTKTAYSPVTVSIPIYRGGSIVGTRSETYYEQGGTETVTPETEIVKYVECTISPFDSTVIIDAFGIDSSATYDQFNLTYGEAIQKMANALKMTLYGTLGNGQMVPLTDAELIAFVNRQNCNATRKHILTTALSLVGKVPYFWGGKSAPGWNDEWNTPKLVTSEGSSSTGTIRPYGMDCSGFTDWVYKTALGVSLYAGTWNQWDNTYAISESELLPGDLGFMAAPGTVPVNHVLIYAGVGENGEQMWVHCSSGGGGVVLNSPDYVTQFRRPANVDFDAPVPGAPTGEPLYSLEVEVTHYCACSRCCGSNADGYTASGKAVARGMVAMSSHYPFGTQIMIGGTMYTVEDRGGSGIENNIHRVDIFVPDHQEALRLGRYTTTATIYRLGR
jgi:3D (Asp-Asp-Asp) domain-containing protein